MIRVNTISRPTLLAFGLKVTLNSVLSSTTLYYRARSKYRKYRPQYWHKPLLRNPIMRLTEKTGPVWVDGVFYNGPVSLEQMIGKTIDPMEEQPRGNYMMPPISYWNKRERLARNPRHCESTYDLSLCSNNPFVCGDYTTKRAIARRIKREDLRK